KYAFLQITRRRFLNEWEAFKKVISRRNIRRRIRSEERFSRNSETDLVCRLLLEKKKKRRQGKQFFGIVPRFIHVYSWLLYRALLCRRRAGTAVILFFF